MYQILELEVELRILREQLRTQLVELMARYRDSDRALDNTLAEMERVEFQAHVCSRRPEEDDQYGQLAVRAFFAVRELHPDLACLIEPLVMEHSRIHRRLRTLAGRSLDDHRPHQTIEHS